ncbi:tetraspanin-33 [Seriola lalandi dorsalis]|uniref:tetraspanin-33 n=1 Tax=Seriola lalandi dorsalis TaxID=1841481 RepID=UPI000C6FA6C0|nr:tetraspanin-33 [Seriola lalandi dorsalis]
MGGRRRGTPGSDEDFSFVSPIVKYLLFIFNFLFWIISLVMVLIGVYARMMKHAEAALACLAVDPAVMLLVVGVLMFVLTFCGCVGSLRENICLLQTFCISLTVIFLLQLTAGILGFIFSDTVVINTMCGQDMQDFEYVDAGNHIHTNGCIDKLVDWIHSNMFLLGGIALGLAIPQLVGIVLSQILINQIKDQVELQNYQFKHRSDPWS